MFCFDSIKPAFLQEVVQELRNASGTLFLASKSIVFVTYFSLLVDFK